VQAILAHWGSCVVVGLTLKNVCRQYRMAGTMYNVVSLAKNEQELPVQHLPSP
jgi:hypothetical protein